MAKKTTVVKKATVTSTITAKILCDAQSTLDGSYRNARLIYHGAIMATIKGNPSSNGEVVNAICYKLSGGKVENLSQARSSKSGWLKAVEKLNNFLSSWCEVKKGKVELLKESKKSKKSSGKESGKASTVTFKKSDAIAMLDKIAQAKGISRKAKSLANQLAEELEA